MKVSCYAKKLYIVDFNFEEKRRLNLYGVNVTYYLKSNSYVAEDNIFNRVLLNLSLDKFLCDVNIKKEDYGDYMRDYQVKDVEKMLKYKSILNRNKMGYGKTLEAIEYCRLLKLKRILVISPKSVIPQWYSQFKKWWPESQAGFSDTPSTLASFQIVCTNYEAFDNLSNWQKHKQFTWDVIICDESHRIKNPRSINKKKKGSRPEDKWTRVQRIRELPTIRKVAMTGTPILKRPDDLWSQLYWLNPEYAGNSYHAFISKFCELEVNPFAAKPVGLTQSDGAKEMLTKALNFISVGGDAQNLTIGKNQIDVILEMTSEQRKLQSELKDLAIDKLQERGVTVKNAMDLTVKFQQLTSNPEKFKLENPKFLWIKEWLEDTEVEKVVIFTHFAETVLALEKYLGKSTAAIYYGGMTVAERSASKARFLSDNNCRALIGTIGALGTGVDGLQEVCHTEIIVDRDWSGMIMEQVEGRVERSGQKELTNIYYLKLKGSIDEHIEEINTREFKDVKEICEWIKSWS